MNNIYEKDYPVTNCEILIATDYNDIIVGTTDVNSLQGFNGDDWFIGKAGNDYMFGGNGSDTVDYYDELQGWNIDLSTNTAVINDNTDTD